MLAEEIVGTAIGFTLDRAMPHIADDADDLVPLGDAARGDRPEVDASPDRILIAEVLAGERLVDHGDMRLVL